MGASVTFALTSRAARIRADLAIKKYMKTLPADNASAFVENIARVCERDLRADIATTPYRPMTWEEMREMEATGMTFAPHTRTHPILSRLPPEKAREEIAGSQSALSRELTRPLSVFAYPNGGKADYSEETIRLLKEAGFTAAFTTEPRSLGKNDSLYELPRFTMDGANDIHRARLIVSGIYNALA